MERHTFLEKEIRSAEANDAQRSHIAWYNWFIRLPEIMASKKQSGMTFGLADHQESEC